MKRVRRWLQYAFGFSARETNGFVILLPLMLLLVLSEPLYRYWLSNRKEDFTYQKHYLDSLVILFKVADSISNPAISLENKYERFDFDPNTADEAVFMKLGVKQAISKRIVNYRNKGGKFKVKSDLLKVYGFDSTLYTSLYHFILLPEMLAKQNEMKSSTSKYKSVKEEVLLDINKADTVMLQSVYGIGSKLSNRIIKYRNALGGFISQKQLYEVYGLDSVVIGRLCKKFFVEEQFSPQQIDLNEADEFVLSAHPYIKKSAAKVIVAYRFQHGKFTQVEELHKVYSLKPEMVEKIIPYLKTK